MSLPKCTFPNLGEVGRQSRLSSRYRAVPATAQTYYNELMTKTVNLGREAYTRDYLPYNLLFKRQCVL